MKLTQAQAPTHQAGAYGCVRGAAVNNSSARREELKLMAELSTLNREVEFYAMHLHLHNVDTQHKPQLPVDQEHAFGERLITLGSAIQARAAQRLDQHPDLIVQAEHAQDLREKLHKQHDDS